jgi:hypothetical protein
MSLLLLFNQNTRAVARELAAQSDEDLTRLRAVVTDAVESGASPAEFAERVNRDVPRASRITPLLEQGGTPIATWLLVLLAIVTLVLQLRAEHPTKPPTPEQIEQIVQRVVQEVNEQERQKPPPDSPDDRIGERGRP